MKWLKRLIQLLGSKICSVGGATWVQSLFNNLYQIRPYLAKPSRRDPPSFLNRACSISRHRSRAIFLDILQHFDKQRTKPSTPPKMMSPGFIMTLPIAISKFWRDCFTAANSSSQWNWAGKYWKVKVSFDFCNVFDTTVQNCRFVPVCGCPYNNKTAQKGNFGITIGWDNDNWAHFSFIDCVQSMFWWQKFVRRAFQYCYCGPNDLLFIF